MKKLLVIADDFTGALDTGVQFSKRGTRTLVLTADQFFSRAVHKGEEVLVVDTESRHLPAREARDTVARVAAEAMKQGVRHFYKKTDSALRGNIGAELAGLLEAGKDPCLTFVPAFPKSRRITRNGIHYIDGVEAAQSVFARDPFTPVTRSAVADVVHLQTDFLTENIASSDYEKAAFKPDKKMIRILDAESMDDIRALGAHLKRGDNLNLLAGCAGFAEILPELLELPVFESTWEKNASNVLVVSGSVNPITLEQLTYGESLGFSTFTLTRAQKLDASYPQSPDCGVFTRRVADELERGGRVIIKTVEAEFPEKNAQNLPANEASRQVADNIGEIALRVLSETRVGNLVVFGGDTLFSVLAKMNCRGVVPLTEISPGIVAAKVLTDRHGGLVITKSGGLGHKEVLREIDDFVFERGNSD
jgi:uncharacterized protein YgbK (DUF1537 family)